MIPYVAPTSTVDIPIIDLSIEADGEAGCRRVAREIGEACRHTGFFYVSGHGLDEDLFGHQFAAARAFFAQPLSAKMTLGGSTGRRGYEPIAAQALDPGSPADLKESALFAADSTVWPDLAGFERQLRHYMAEMTQLGRRLARSLALSLDLPATYFVPMFTRANVTSRMLRYPPHPAAAAANQLGSGAHTDWGFLTILLQDEVGGLEVQTVDDRWVAAPPVRDTLVINLGDMVPYLTNGRYRSNFHRVLNNGGSRDRYSVATFVNPAADVVFDCVPTCRPAGWQPAPRTVGEHIQAKIEETYGRPKPATARL